jgi:putative oxidoreductase
MVVAVYLAHTHQIFTRGPSGGWALELQGMFLFAAIALLFLGAGSYSIGGKSGKWN